nr:PREDICTED: benzoate carboxyl methyltransferase-like isoform X2 [Daucus carota subsp. sativus]
MTSFPCMNAGSNESSYAKNSVVQKTVILKSRNILEKTIEDYAVKGFPECFKLADLGCSSGPNTLLVVTNIIKNVHAICKNKKQAAPEIQVFLNDLPDNDFNTVFKMVPPLLSNMENCFISGVPGSFYTRLFPSKSIHLVHSSYSVHWLSKVPDKLENNKGNIYMSKTSPPGVHEAYFNQFKKDFMKFLRLRSEEVIPNGRMVLTIVGRSGTDPTSKECCGLWELLVMSLQDMVAEGLLDEKDIDTFNLPLYTPCVDEVLAIVELEGSFKIDRWETSQVNWDTQDENEAKSVKSKGSSGKIVAMAVR